MKERNSCRIVLALVLAAMSNACTSMESGQCTDLDVLLLSWNILHGVSPEEHDNLKEKGDYLLSQGADLAFLQEVDRRVARSGSVDQLKELARITSAEPIFASFMAYQGGHYGSGALSYLPVIQSRLIELPDGLEPRVALALTIAASGHEIIAVNVHFDWAEDDTARYAQAGYLLASLQEPDSAMIIAGDFNDTPESRTLKLFYEAGFRHADRQGNTWPAVDPSMDIDHILVKDGGRSKISINDGGVLPETRLSDHRPVFSRVVFSCSL